MPQCAHNPLWLLLQADPATRIVPSQPSPQLSLRTRGLRNSRTGKRLRAGPGETWRVPPLAWKIALCLARLPITSPASSPRYSDREYPSLPVSLPAFRAVMVPGRAARRLDAVASARSEQLGRGFLQGWGFRRVLVVGEALVDLPRGLVEAPRKARAGEGPGDLLHFPHEAPRLARVVAERPLGAGDGIGHRDLPLREQRRVHALGEGERADRGQERLAALVPAREGHLQGRRRSVWRVE